MCLDHHKSPSIKFVDFVDFVDFFDLVILVLGSYIYYLFLSIIHFVQFLVYFWTPPFILVHSIPLFVLVHFDIFASILVQMVPFWTILALD